VVNRSRNIFRASHRSSKSFNPRGSKSLSRSSRRERTRKVPKMPQENVDIMNAASESQQGSVASTIRNMQHADINFDREVSDDINQDSNPNLTSRPGSKN
jgi:ribosomal protein L20